MKKSLEALKLLHQAGHLEEAEAGYRALLNENPQNVMALHGLAILCSEKNKFDEARHYLQQAMALDPKSVSHPLHLATVLKAQGLQKEAEGILGALINAHPRFAAAFNNLGTVYAAQQKWEEAVGAYQSAIDIQANYIDAYYNLGLALNKLHRTVEAAKVYEALLSLSEDHVGAHFQWGCLLMQQNRYEDAIKHFLAIEKKHPHHAETQANLATCFLQLGQLSLAQTHYANSLALTPKEAELAFNLGVISMQQGRVVEAIDFYLRALKINPDYYEAHNNISVAYLAVKNIDAARHHYCEILRLQPHNEAVQHTMRILKGEKNIVGSPPEYIRSLFDAYADHYEDHLKQSLHYQVPQQLYQAVQKVSDDHYRHWEIADLGCGTGLCGELFKTPTNTLVGVDLSQKMLDRAAQKKNYDALVLSDVIPFLHREENAYDLILAGDVMVYFGEMTDIFSAIHTALKPKGWFVFNTEISEEDDYHMTLSGRFAHRQAYLDAVARQCRLQWIYHQTAILRTQDHMPVRGIVVVLQKG